MTKTREQLAEELESAEMALKAAEEAVRRARHEHWLASLGAASMWAKDFAEQNRDMPAKEFGERVADAARDHGSECGALGRPETTASWRRFRVLLAELVRRAEAGK